jgi:hypothetical protein
MRTTLTTVQILTDASGNFTQNITGPDGMLSQYRYVPDGTVPLATGASISMSGATSGFVYINQTNIGTSAFTKLPRYPTDDSTGTALLYASAGIGVADTALVGPEQLTVTIALGGNAKKGLLYVWTSH